MSDSNGNRRKHSRVKASKAIHFRTAQPVQATLIDMSDGGISFSSDRDLFAGVEIEVMFLGQTISAKGVVRSSMPGDDGNFRLGIEFEKEERDLVEGLLDTPTGKQP